MGKKKPRKRGRKGSVVEDSLKAKVKLIRMAEKKKTKETRDNCIPRM